MGCDIHMFTEFKKRNSERGWWRPLGGEIKPGRNYYIFGLMSKGVRGEIEGAYPPRGLPSDMAYEAQDHSRLYISEDGDGDDETTIERARVWEKQGYKITERNGKPVYVEHPDWHSHSWLTVSEFKDVLTRVMEQAKKDDYQVTYYEAPYFATLAAMEKLEELGNDTRIVFWFDN